MAETLKIKDFPIEARPREAFMRAGEPEREIPDANLLAILIRSGRKGSSAIDLAHRLIKHFGGTANLVDATWQQIVAAKVPGVGKVAAVQLAAAFALVKRNVKTSHRSFVRAIETSDDVVRQVRSIGIDETQECTFALYLDAKRQLLCEPIRVTRGTADRTFMHPRDIFRQAIRLGAVSVIVAHNHPSGDATPSAEDISETKRLVEVGNVVGIPLDDHVVIGGASKRHVSIRGLDSALFVSTPSDCKYAADYDTTVKLNEGASIVGLELIDHLIIGAPESANGLGFVSMAELMAE